MKSGSQNINKRFVGASSFTFAPKTMCIERDYKMSNSGPDHTYSSMMLDM